VRFGKAHRAGLWKLGMRFNRATPVGGDAVVQVFQATGRADAP
jgi:hypothetical protein